MATTKRPADFGPIQLADHLGLPTWAFETARERGLIPGPNVDGHRWSAALATELAGKVAEIVAVVGTEPPIGGWRSAERLAARTGLEVDRADVEVLADRGLLTIADYYKEWPLYDPRELDTVPASVVAEVVAERQAWLAASLHRRDAAAQLGWRLAEFDRVAAQRGLTAGRFGRYARGDVEAFGRDLELAEQVEADRQIGPDQAAERLEVRRRDYDYAVAAGWITPERWVDMPVGRRSTVRVPLYRTGDVDALRDLPGVDWEEVRAVRKSEPSPLRDYARLAPPRAQIIRRFADELRHRHQVEVWAYYRGGPDLWCIEWHPTPTGEPTRKTIADELAADPVLATYRDDIQLSTDAGEAVRWARAMLQPGAAVLLDTETTSLGGSVCELAVLDTTGQVLLDALVNPGRPISLEAHWIHGISDDDVADAPTWPQILPRLLEVTAGRQVLAYNAAYDREVIHTDTAHHGLDLAHLADPARWDCLMMRRSDWNRTRRWSRLGGGHRALADTRAGLQVLQAMTAAQTTRARI